MFVLVNREGLFYNGCRLIGGQLKVLWSKEQSFIFGGDKDSMDDLKAMQNEYFGSTIKELKFV